MRALFELLVGISTDLKGSMKDRIKSIYFFDEQEKKDLAKNLAKVIREGVRKYHPEFL